MAKPLWKIRSGDFAGWRIGDALYSAGGGNVGYFDGKIAYSLDGDYIGEIYRDDWIGRRGGIIRGKRGARVGFVGIALAAYANRVGLAVGNWSDPGF